MSTVSKESALERKKRIYTERIRHLRAMKIEETKKKIAYNGHTDEDDYNWLCPLPGYSWKPKGDTPNGDFHGYRGWSENYASMLRSFPPVVQPENSMCGNFYRILQKFRKLRWHENWDLSPWLRTFQKYGIDHGLGQIHHFCGDSRIGLKLGWEGLREKVLRCAQLNQESEEQKEFYRAEIAFLDACMEWMDRTIDCVREKLAQEKDEGLRENLEGMLAANERVRHHPPETLREACTFLSWYNLFGRSFNREGCGGQLDELLRPYYEHDIALGLIDDEDAVYYIAGLLFSDTKYYQLGGPDENGRDMVSPVSWLILEAADRMDVSLNLTIRVHDGLPRDFFRRGVELLFRHRNGWPRFSGDQSLVEGFMRRGFSRELAAKRIAVGCNWMAIPGLEYPLNDSIKVNQARIFEVAYDEMMAEGERSTARLFDLYRKHLKIVLACIADSMDFDLNNNRYNSPELFLNLFMVGPIEKGRDASDHSVPYYNIGIDGAGIAVAANSFAALEQRVEKEGIVTWDAVYTAVRNNFEAKDDRYVRAVMKSSGRFGQPGSLGNAWAKKLTELFRDEVVALKSKEISVFIPGMFSWSKTLLFGGQVGATPDGRRAGEPVNHGANPMPGDVRSGAMTDLSEAINLCQCGMGNTSPFQMELDPGIIDMEDGVEKVMALLETHLKRGGTLINVNIVDADRIRAAHKNPELYPDLVVRVTGFTAYFITLTPEFRQLVVDRLMEAR